MEEKEHEANGSYLFQLVVDFVAENKRKREAKFLPKNLNCLGCEKKGLILCNQCHDAYYCSDECQKLHSEKHKRSCFKFPDGVFEDAENKILHEAHRMSLFTEFKKLETSEIEASLPHVSYKRACYFLYKGIIGMILFDPVCADIKEIMTEEETLQWEEFRADIRKSYQLMEQCHPNRFLNNESGHWLVIPRVLHRDVADICDID